MSSNAFKEQRKRDLTAIIIAVALHLFVIGLMLLSNLLFYRDVEEYRGPVLVKLGRVNAPDEETDTLPVAPISTVEEESSVVEDTSESLEEIKTGNPEETVQIDESQNESAIERPVSDDENGDRGDSDTSSQETNPESSAVNEETSTTDAEELVTVTKGSEEGNAYETTYEATPGLVGRNLWIPIYMYMPLPQYVDKRIFDSIKSDEQLSNRPGTRTAESKVEFLLTYYKPEGDEYYLFNPPDEDLRPQIWSILEDGAYELQYAEYKDGKNLRPVILTFTVNTNDEGTEIVDIQVNRSSGYGDIDDAVVYGFLKASFYNSSDIPVKGRFTYRFE